MLELTPLSEVDVFEPIDGICGYMIVRNVYINNIHLYNKFGKWYGRVNLFEEDYICLINIITSFTESETITNIPPRLSDDNLDHFTVNSQYYRVNNLLDNVVVDTSKFPSIYGFRYTGTTYLHNLTSDDIISGTFNITILEPEFMEYDQQRIQWNFAYLLIHHDGTEISYDDNSIVSFNQLRQSNEV